MQNLLAGLDDTQCTLDWDQFVYELFILAGHLKVLVSSQPKAESGRMPLFYLISVIKAASLAKWSLPILPPGPLLIAGIFLVDCSWGFSV